MKEMEFNTTVDEYLERQILLGLLTDKDYITKVAIFWDDSFIKVPEIKWVARWAWEYWENYKEVMGKRVWDRWIQESHHLSRSENSYLEALIRSLDLDDRSQLNTDYLYARTADYVKKRWLENHNQKVQELLRQGRVEEAEKLQLHYVPPKLDVKLGVELSDPIAPDVDQDLNRAFEKVSPLFELPGALGELMNEHLVRGGFIAVMAPEKRGKSWFLLDLAMRAVRHHLKVAYFDTGDMSYLQLLRRIAIYIAQKSDRVSACGARWRSTVDCILHQTDQCSLPEREPSMGAVISHSFANLREITPAYIQAVREASDTHRDHTPCTACKAIRPGIWRRDIPAVQPLTPEEAKVKVAKWFSHYRGKLKISNHPSGTLTVGQMKKILDSWEKYEGFTPDVIVVDYADLMGAVDSTYEDFRHQQDYIWRGLRSIALERNLLVITATQAAARAYKAKKLDMTHFSEDKRKLAHVSAMFGLSQEPEGVERDVGMIRLTPIVLRDAELPSREVGIIQDIKAGRAVLAAFWVGG
ncbi:MAG: hypothetical protein QXT45_04655 [Candidatus Bilamarchaeaceae archaeon]